jgi:tRNA (uracil-5-)-methyltransferase TRM9
MRTEVSNRLSRINLEFYQTFAGEFSETRQRLQPGVERLLDQLPSRADILDLGCGNGELAQRLLLNGYRGRYLGIDSSESMVGIARSRAEGESIAFEVLDITRPDFLQASEVQKHILSFETLHFVLAFAVLHHIPGAEQRRRILTSIGAHLSRGARFMISNWNFLQSEKWIARIVPWEQVGLTDEEVEPGDYVLDWRRGGRGLRYVHHFTEDELAGLANQTGFQVIDAFYSDGEGGKLGIYQVWETA